MHSETLLNAAMDFGLMSMLLVIAHLLRSRIAALQNTLVPTSIIAGFLGLLGGWQLLDWLPFSTGSGAGPIPTMTSYPGFLVVLLFATLFMGRQPGHRSGARAAIRDAGDTFFYNLASLVGMYGLALLFGAVVLAWLFPELHAGFALMLPAGFVGGHGTATAIGLVPSRLSLLPHGGR